MTVTATNNENASITDSENCWALCGTCDIFGKATAYSYDQGGAEPWENYQAGEYPPIMCSKENVGDEEPASAFILPPVSLSLGENTRVTLTVAIPEDAVACTEDNVTVTATSQADNTVENSASCIAHVPIVRGVEVIVEPDSQPGVIGENVVFTVTVKNTGNVWDNYKLENNDDAGWGLELDNDYLEIPKDENRGTKLTVSVPDNENLVCTTDNITVTATAMDNAEVTDNGTVTVHAVLTLTLWEGTAAFSVVNLYTVNVNMTLDIYQGSKLVVKFYDYSDVFESENVIETFSPPWHVEENEHARHPSIGGENIGVRKARLVLTTDDTGNVIATVASFTVCKLDLATRYSDIPSRWLLLPTPEEKLALAIEFSELPTYWLLAPD